MPASQTIDMRLTRVGTGVLRWSLVFFFVAFGAFKFTTQEAAAVAPLMAHSPFLFWVPALFGQQGGSILIGVVEITLAVLIALRHVSPVLSAYGSLGTAGALLITQSFLFTTPGLDPQSSDAGFLLKDLTLFGAALLVSGEAFGAAREPRPGSA